jgi:hypothetical protein
MYSNIDLETLKKEARQFVIQNDRMLYQPYLDFIEAYCADNNMFLAGDLAIARLTGDCEPRGFCDAFYEIFCDNVYPTAQEMVTKLYLQKSPFLSPDTLVLSTIVKHRELVISINARPIVRMWGIERIKGQNVARLLPRSLYMPIESYMIGIYKQLYTPSAVRNWPDALRRERRLFAKWAGEHQEEIDDALDMPRKYDHLSEALFNKIPSIIVVGDYALGCLLPVNKRRLQFLSDESPDTMSRNIKKVLASGSTKIQRVYYVNHPLVMPADFQLTKHTFYAQTQHATFALCDVYNSTEYELIPIMQTVAKHTRVPHPWVLLKFYYLDLWVDLLLGRKPSQHICMNIKKARAVLGDNPVAPRDYTGHLILDRAAKKAMLAEGPRISDFIPAKKTSLAAVRGGDPARPAVLAGAVSEEEYGSGRDE